MENKLTASELRIGNYYNHNGKIRQVTPNTILEVWEAEREWCKAIPLTEEWLLKLGFTKKENKQYWYKENNMLRFVLLYGSLHCSIGDDENGMLYKIISFIHELQNLYFALTNEELTIK
jgi:hypothetical protein